MTAWLRTQKLSFPGTIYGTSFGVMNVHNKKCSKQVVACRRTKAVKAFFSLP
jgi:hypothetical protein